MVGLTVRAGPAAVATVDPDAARQTAREILDGSKFEEPRFPRPFKGVLEWMADLIRPVLDLLHDVFGPSIRALAGVPGGRFVLAAVAGGLAGALVYWLARRRSRSAVVRDGGAGLVDLRSDPAALDREADDAEAAGDHALAVRRRYEAGLLRLVRSERLVLRPETTPGAAARQVDRPTMDLLTSDFEEIVYGGRPAGGEDSLRAREMWADLLGAEVGR